MKEYCIELDKHCNKLEEHCDEIKDMYDELKGNYSELSKKYAELLNEYSENTIIQSMNDMKNRYNELMIDTISICKYNELQDKYDVVSKNSIANLILLERVFRYLKYIKNNNNYKETDEGLKLELELIMIKEIIEECVPKKLSFNE